jgi:hypothetical protein
LWLTDGGICVNPPGAPDATLRHPSTLSYHWRAAALVRLRGIDRIDVGSDVMASISSTRERGTTMRKLTRQVFWAGALSFGIAAAILLSANTAFAQTQSYKQLSAQWWQWALSIPADANPLTDTTGEDCMVGQRGSDWFLAGMFVGGSATRECSIPQGVSLFFPVANFIGFDNPGQCGQDEPFGSAFWRGLAADFVNGVSAVSVTLDGQPVKGVQRVQSQVFEIALPVDSLFAPFCDPALQAGIYSPAVDEGFYVRLNPLAVGQHTLHFHAENASQFFEQDVTYVLTVVPVVTK